MENDVKRPKLDRVFKDAETANAVGKVILNNVHYMLDQFNYMIANSRFPTIAAIQLIDFCKDMYIIDNRTLSGGDLEVILANTMVSGSAQSSLLRRFEYFELFIRVAKMKFLDRGKVKTLDEAMKMLIDNHFKVAPRPRPGLPPPQSGQDFRERYAWRSDMDDLLRSNM